MKALLLAGLLSGCAAAPNTVRTAVQHQSHLSQHFDGSRENLGAQLLNVTAQWRFGHWFAEVGESYNLSPDTRRGWVDYCRGGICGNRELTTVSAGYVFEVKP